MSTSTTRTTIDRAKHVAVVYFHGMGSQRRQEELCQLVDALDRFAFSHDMAKEVSTEESAEKDSAEKSELNRIEVRVETPHADREVPEHLTSDVSYIRTNFRQTNDDGKTSHIRRVQFYEAYWASATAGGVPAMEVLRWLLGRIPNPIRSLRTRWRLRARLRRISLRRMWSCMLNQPSSRTYLSDLVAVGRNWKLVYHRKWAELLHKVRLSRPRPLTSSHLEALLFAYHDFESLDARRKYPTGSFKQFQHFLRERLSEDPRWMKKPQDIKRLLNMARRWRTRYVLGEMATLFVLLTFALTLALAVGGVFAGAWHLVNYLMPGSIARDMSQTDKIQNALYVMAAFLTLAGVYGFLQNYMGDVLHWTTLAETDERFKKREEILKAGTAMLRHVLLDENCERVVVVAHSLGTSIAFDSLLELGRYNWARNPEAPMECGPKVLPLNKIEHFITMGSPIDLTHYFFESNAGGSHRYNRVSDKMRGDLAAAPFGKNRKPYVHWINLWDKSDIISGPLESPTPAIEAELNIDNCEVASYLFPFPRSSHSAYFENEKAIDIIYQSVFHRAFSFKTLTAGPGKQGINYTSQYVGPGDSRRTTRPQQLLVLALPWLLVASGLCVKVGWIPYTYAIAAVGTPALVLFVSLLCSWRLKIQPRLR
ncbi:MAG: hypothetical protein IT423_09570 [Pirellulaceae bacterium]|nr:hypothetical protein [Pirellulaceae bacterium]